MSQKHDDAVGDVQKAVTEELCVGTWYVYESYEVQDGLSDGGRHVQAPPARWHEDTGRLDPWRWEYEPLIKHEDLFLRFARLPEDGGLDGGEDLDTDKNAEVARTWAETYGVLGLTTHDVPGWHSGWSDPAGGEGDTVAAFAVEAWAANRVLRLYDAATRSGESPDGAGVDVETIMALTTDPSHRRALVRSPDQAKRFALSAAVREIHDRKPYYHPALYWSLTRHGLPTGEFAQGWDFTNLLGAIWLQALWLLSAGPGNVKRCQYCNRIIVYEQPAKPQDQKRGERKPYKTRRDIDYCPDDTRRWCRQKASQARRRGGAG